MAVPKYRPTLTMDEIESLIEAADFYEPTCEVVKETLKTASRNLKMFKFKADMGVNAPASITTGKKPGPTSARDILLADEKEDTAKQLKSMPLEQAKVAAQTYKSLGVPVPADIQAILDSETSEE